ncbi:MAG: hypothetical protein AAF591_17470 [Verrucomicrobiota bacterium]
MYQQDARNKEYVTFQCELPEAKSVVLVGDVNRERWRMPMRRRRGAWEVSVKLSMGMFLYALEVDGRATWDRDAGRVKACGGQDCSLALIA